MIFFSFNLCFDGYEKTREPKILSFIYNSQWEHSRPIDHFLTINSLGRWLWQAASGDSCSLPLIGAVLALDQSSCWESIHKRLEVLDGLIHDAIKNIASEANVSEV